MGKISKNIILISAALCFILAVSSLILVKNASAAADREYRFGQVVAIDGKNYLVASDKEFAEILQITADNKLSQVSEIHGADKIEALAVEQDLKKTYLIIASGRYLYRYDISNPAAPKIEFKRDLYVTPRGQFKIGSVYALAGSKGVIFGGGANGVRSFLPDNLFVNKIYTFDKSYGIAADDKFLYVITADKGLVFDILTGNKLAETDLENAAKTTRLPYFDDSSNAYFPSDRGLVKLNIYSQKQTSYLNPVANNDNFSYGAVSLPGGNIYYANGHGITSLDKNFNKTKFINTSWQERFGANSWAVSLAAVKIGARGMIINFNKSSILLLDKDLKALAQYKYKKSYPDSLGFDLKITASANQASPGQKINLKLYGFWPNENVAVTFGSNKYSIKVDNQGYASTDIAVPAQNSRQAIIQATGNDSKFSYQTSFVVL